MEMKIIHIALFLAIVLVSSSAGGMAARFTPEKSSSNWCNTMIWPGPMCDHDACSSDCAKKFDGGLGDCIRAGCMCAYSGDCAPPPPPPSPPPVANWCNTLISPGPACNHEDCSANCAHEFKGGVGECIRAGCMCAYYGHCAPPPSLAVEN
ncbi:unnamed protein product [Alopecurus aequalis]